MEFTTAGPCLHTAAPLLLSLPPGTLLPPAVFACGTHRQRSSNPRSHGRETNTPGDAASAGSSLRQRAVGVPPAAYRARSAGRARSWVVSGIGYRDRKRTQRHTRGQLREGADTAALAQGEGRRRPLGRGWQLPTVQRIVYKHLPNREREQAISPPLQGGPFPPGGGPVLRCEPAGGRLRGHSWRGRLCANDLDLCVPHVSIAHGRPEAGDRRMRPAPHGPAAQLAADGAEKHTSEDVSICARVQVRWAAVGSTMAAAAAVVPLPPLLPPCRT